MLHNYGGGNSPFGLIKTDKLQKCFKYVQYIVHIKGVVKWTQLLTQTRGRSLLTI